MGDDGGDLAGVLARARGAGVGTMLTIGTKLREFDIVRAIAEANSDVVCSVGIHPHEAGSEATDVAQLVALAAHPKVVGIGETGLDYFYDKSPRQQQQQSFRTHLAAARATGPVMESTTCCRGASQGMPEPDAKAGPAAESATTKAVLVTTTFKYDVLIAQLPCS